MNEMSDSALLFNRTVGSDVPIAVTCVIPCKGRLHHLRETVPLLMKQTTSFAFRLVLVDYGCPDGVFSWVRTLDHPSLDCLAVLDKVAVFNVSRARNCGNRVARSSVIAVLDADCCLHSRFVLEKMAEPVVTRHARSTHITLHLNHGEVHNAHSCMVYRREDWEMTRGYDEAMCGYGYEDTDFYERIKGLGHCQELTAKFEEFDLIRHSDEMRTRHYEEKNKLESWVQNRSYAQQRACCNPTVFGSGRFLYAVGGGEVLHLEANGKSGLLNKR